MPGHFLECSKNIGTFLIHYIGRKRQNGNTGIFAGSNRKGRTDLFIIAGLPLTYKINRKMVRIGERLMPGRYKETD